MRHQERERDVRQKHFSPMGEKGVVASTHDEYFGETFSQVHFLKTAVYQEVHLCVIDRLLTLSC